MRFKSRTWYLISLVLFGAAAWMWHHGEEVSARRHNSITASAKTVPPAPLISASNTNVVGRRKSYRLSNTSETVAQLLRDDHAIILRNALIDTRRPARLDIPAQLRAKGPAGSYIVQFDRPLNREFYDSIKKDGAAYVSYIPNNAALVKADAEGARQLEADPVFQAVLPYEPYYKLDGTLLPGAVEQEAQTNLLSVTTFAGQRDAALKALSSLGAKLISEDQTPFGPALVVSAPPGSVAAIAQLPLAQEVESYSSRRLLNDLSRVQLGVSSDTLIGTPDYMNLSGSNIMVNMNDTGVDSTLQDFYNASGVTRIIGAVNDSDGHGTHVAGIIAGNGSQSSQVSPPPPGSVANADFRGKATNVSLFVQSLDLNLGPNVSDAQLAQTASRELGPTNLISNNSWGYADSTVYDMHAASYDAATRDAQPLVSGEQPLLFVFAAGDGGDGDDTGVDGLAGTITSPGTAKNVITVGATDTPRFITNEVTYDFLNTNEVFFGETDNSNLVAPFSSGGNVGAGTEGTYGRFKPDVVAPGVFIVSDRAHNYVDPTVATYIYLSVPIPAQSVSPGQTNYYPVPTLPSDTSEIVAYVSPNSLSPIPFPGLQLLADPATPPTDIVEGPGSNTLVINNFEGSTNWYIGVTTASNEVQPEAYDLVIYILTTNALGDYYTVLQDMNDPLKPYMYQSGTSMSAGAVSGVLALMQDFLRNRLEVTNPSPALMKAMLINGSRSLGLQYDFNAQTLGVNEQGWGMPNLTNCIPESLTNTGSPSTSSMLFIDQSPTNALATGQSQTYEIQSSDMNISNYPIRFTLVWTDPPGDPAAGVALVNDLGLTVVDSTGTNVYIGNDFFSGDIYSEVNTGDAPDFINNVQNIYIDSTYAPISFPLYVTVSGYRVNVNAVTTATNQIAQDYALVMSTDDPALEQPMTVAANPVFNPPPAPLITVASNGTPLLHQRVGANEPNYYDYPIGQTNGNLQQWHFFTFSNVDVANTTNTTTNVAFATFLPPNLSIPRNSQAGIDMYVSTNPALLTLDTNAVYDSYKELGPGGTKSFVTNSTVTNWYIGIKSEDQQAADFGFYAVAQQAPFSVNNPDGSVTATGTALPVVVNDASQGGAGYIFAFLIDTANPDLILQNATVTLGVPFGNPSDSYGTLNHDGVSVVLNHHTGQTGGFTNTYDDLQEDPNSGNVGTSGPGSLKNYIGQPGQGMWQLTELDNALYQNGQVLNFNVTAYPQPLGLGFTITIQPNTWYKDYVLVPNDATNLNIYLTYASQGGGPVGLYLTNVDNVQLGDYGSNAIIAPGGFVGLSTNVPSSGPPYSPPLSGGPWFYGIYNGTLNPVTLNVLIQIQESLTPNLVQTFTNNTVTPLTTDGTTQSQICITSGQQVVDLSVGVRINDPDLDDLVLHLTSPQGTSILLFENRGGTNAHSLGLGNLLSSNLIYTVFTDDTNLTTTPVKFAPIFATDNAVATNTIITSDTFDTVTAETYTNGQTVGNWTVASNQVGVETEATVAHSGNNYLALTSGRITNTFATVPGAPYELQYWARGPGITDWWPADDNTDDIVGTDDATIPYSDVTYDVGEVGRAFTFSGISPDNNNTGNEVDFGTSVGNFGTSDFTVDFWIKQPAGASAIYGILEKRPQCNADVSMWCVRSGPVEGHPTTTPGALSLTVSDNNQVNHVYLNGSRLINDGIYHHAAFVRNGLTLSIYVDGVLDSSAVGPGIANIDNSVMFRAGQSICVPPSFGDPPDGSIPFTGDLDELDVYDRGLSPAEIYAIHHAGSLGKYNTNSLLPNFEVTIDGYSTNTIILTNFDGPWRLFTNSFIATNTQTTIELAGNTMSTLFDDIQLIKLPSTNYNNYFLPEEPLTPFIGEDPQGCWTLDVWDTRTDSLLTNNGALLSWDLQLTSSSTNVNLIVLTNRVPYVGGIVSNSIVYFAFDVPLTANFATNILSNVVSGPLNLLFNQSVLPTGGMPGDVDLLTAIASQGQDTIDTLGAPPPLVPGRRYFLGVQNTASTIATFTLEVDTDVGSNNTNIYALTNEVALATNNISANGPEYYSFTVPTNATMVTFQLLDTTNAELDLYARAGLPVPGPFNFDYQSRNAGTNDQFIVVTTNSEPVPLPIVTTNTVVPLSPTTWYLSVYNPAGVANAGYTIVATYVTNVVTNSLTAGALDVIPLTATHAYTNSAAPGFPTNFLYSFTVTNKPAGVQFVVANLAGFGNVELFVQSNTFPTPEQSYSGSFNPGTTSQLIAFGTNADLPSANGTWYLSVPNDTPGTNTNSVLYSITASTLANVPNPVEPEFANGSVSAAAQQFSLTWTASPGQSYAVEVSTNLTTWSTVTTIVAQSNTVSYTDSVPVSSQRSRFFRLSSP